MSKASPHTLIFSDIHLTTAEPADPKRPLWKRYKQADLFVDEDIAAMLAAASLRMNGPGELVLNGDIFDFDAVTTVPATPGQEHITWVERLRGLNATEEKSRFKMALIALDHPVFFEALREWVKDGNEIIFTIGNHDIEMHWPAVQQEILKALDVGPLEHKVRFCDWFYLSNGDTLIEHGNQYDPYCVCADPLNPLIAVPPGNPRVRLPFGNYASRYMINGMGLFNPHADSTFLRSFWGYVVYFYRHVARTQPLLPWTWLWSAAATFLASMRDGLLPSLKNPLTLDQHVQKVADQANSTPRVVRGLAAVKTHSAIFNPWKVAKELWLDRLLLFVLVVLGGFQVMATLHVLTGASVWWYFLILGFLFPPFLFYARSVDSDIHTQERHLRQRLPVLRELTGVDRLVLGHTHEERHTRLNGFEILNSGSWSPAYEDPECSKPFGLRCVVWISPNGSAGRVASLEEWNGSGFREIPPDNDHIKPTLNTPANLLLNPALSPSGNRPSPSSAKAHDS